MRTSLLAHEVLDLFHVTCNVRNCRSVDLVQRVYVRLFCNHRETVNTSVCITSTAVHVK
jgi:hypothetical protein